MSDIQDYINFVSERYLAIRPRSVKEMHTYLQRKLRRFELSEEKTDAYIGSTLQNLISRNLLDDAAFAKWYVDEKVRFKSRGPIRLKLELKAKGIADEHIEKALAHREEDDETLITRLLETKYRSVNLNDLHAKQKVISGLMRRGFSIAAIKKSIEELTTTR